MLICILLIIHTLPILMISNHKFACFHWRASNAQISHFYQCSVSTILFHIFRQCHRFSILTVKGKGTISHFSQYGASTFSFTKWDQTPEITPYLHFQTSLVPDTNDLDKQITLFIIFIATFFSLQILEGRQQNIAFLFFL